jgi:hypothetical protein
MDARPPPPWPQMPPVSCHPELRLRNARPRRPGRPDRVDAYTEVRVRKMPRGRWPGCPIQIKTVISNGPWLHRLRNPASRQRGDLPEAWRLAPLPSRRLRGQWQRSEAPKPRRGAAAISLTGAAGCVIYSVVGSSYLEYRDAGFWVSEYRAEVWLYLMAQQAQTMADAPSWLAAAASDWHAQGTVGLCRPTRSSASIPVVWIARQSSQAMNPRAALPATTSPSPSPSPSSPRTGRPNGRAPAVDRYSAYSMVSL